MPSKKWGKINKEHESAIAKKESSYKEDEVCMLEI